MELRTLSGDDFFDIDDFNDNFNALQSQNTAHAANKNNPHTVTPAQVGGTANLTTVTQAVAEAGTNTAVYAWTSQRVRQSVTAALTSVNSSITKLTSDLSALTQKVDGFSSARITAGILSTATGTVNLGWQPIAVIVFPTGAANVAGASPGPDARMRSYGLATRNRTHKNSAPTSGVTYCTVTATGFSVTGMSGFDNGGTTTTNTDTPLHYVAFG